MIPSEAKKSDSADILKCPTFLKWSLNAHSWISLANMAEPKDHDHCQVTDGENYIWTVGETL